MSTLFTGATKVDAAGRVEDFWMLVDGTTIAATGTGTGYPRADETVEAAGRWLVPGFIDLHGHGGGGQSYDDGPDAIAAALAVHRAHGTTRSVVSLVANPVQRLLTSLDTIATIAEQDPLVLGSHLEGPFLALSRQGAHNPEFLRDPTPELAGELIDASRGTLRQLTIAPELPGALETIDRLVARGVTVGVGHTEASYEIAGQAFDHGATILTHAFNAMPGIHHRAPGPVIAAFHDHRVTLELILDGHHVHAGVASTAFSSAPGRIALVTDAMAAAGVGDGDYRLGSLNVSVRNEQAMLSGTSTLAGSTLTQDAALRYAILTAGIQAVDAVAALTSVPARSLGLHDRLGLLKPGYQADAVLLDAELRVERVWAAGLPLG
jgi:N-acetylglucosamine-6-phosphate deacetylase